MKVKALYIDASIGGNGEIWMRLLGFYTIAGLMPSLKIYLLVPKFLKPICRSVFSDRLNFLEEDEKQKCKYEFTNLGTRHLIWYLFKGKRFIAPIQRTAIRDKKGTSKTKIWMNDIVSIFFDGLGLIQIPDIRWANAYHGYLEMASIRKFRKIDYEAFKEKSRSDYTALRDKLRGDIPVSPELKIPLDLKNFVLVFPTGTSRQFMPLEWAKKNLPDAYYAFHDRNDQWKDFDKAGLKTVLYYKEPGDMIKLSLAAKWTILTDSFHSHVIQSVNENSTVLITELVLERVVNPSYRGKTVDSLAPCHPCIHMTASRICAAGLRECLNWEIELYKNNIMSSFKSN